MTDRDLETRERLLRTAERLFADRGFRRITVRDISRAARANVAAVNYHFGSKLGLYREVLKRAAEGMNATTETAKQAGAACPADERLRRFIQVFLRRVMSPDASASCTHRLINREMSDPTPALDALVDRGLRPRIEYLRGVIAELMGVPPDDPRVMRCVASVQSQAITYLPNALAARLMDRSAITAEEIDEIARHIAEFSLAGIQAIANPGP